MSFYIFAVIRIFIDCKRSVFFYQHQIILLKIVILMLICLFVGFVLFVFDITWGEKYQWIKIRDPLLSPCEREAIYRDLP